MMPPNFFRWLLWMAAVAGLVLLLLGVGVGLLL